MEEAVKQFALWAAVGSEAAAALIISIAMLEALSRVALAFGGELNPRGDTGKALERKEKIRLRFARWLALSLEFLLAADILRTAVAPSWEEIGQLAAIAALRTALNFFLHREIEQAELRRTKQES